MENCHVLETMSTKCRVCHKNYFWANGVCEKSKKYFIEGAFISGGIFGLFIILFIHILLFD